MNVTELARKFKITTNELLEMLPSMGFDIGKRAIKINDVVAHRIIKEWPRLLAKYKEANTKEKEVVEEKILEKKIIAIPEYITIKELATKSGIPVTRVLTTLMKNGMLLSMNEKIDFDTATIISAELGIELVRAQADQEKSEKKVEMISDEDKSSMISRPAVVVIMGHVDHGKTKLLDTIRTTNIAGKESGGITQHIGAYQINKKGKAITFIDTPGHEAFTTMRSRGARIADIAVLVIAADDGMKPQTKESIRIIQSANIPMIVAINKIDKPDANIEKVKQELAQENLLPEDWGGKTICQPISAKTGDGIDELIDTILLMSDMEKDKICANPDRNAIGTIIESHIDVGEGSVATVLVQNGTLKQGDLVFIDDIFYGKVRSLKNFLGKLVDSAPPSMPVRILGLKGIPSVGDILQVKNTVERNSKRKNYQLKTQAAGSYTPLARKEKKGAEETFNIILRTDVLGSLEAIISSLDKLENPDIHLNIIGKGLGNINENDVLLAESNNAMVIGFHSNPSQAAQSLAQEKNINIKNFKVIYELLDEVKNKMEEKLKPNVQRIILGKVKVLKIFKKEKNSMIIGAHVVSGNAIAHANTDVLSGQTKIGQGVITKLQNNKIEVDEISQGHECGIQFEGKANIQEGDYLELYREEITQKTLG